MLFGELLFISIFGRNTKTLIWFQIPWFLIIIPEPVIVKDTFQLKIINKNPFKVSRVLNKPTISMSKKGVSKQKTKTAVISWPAITYYGYVKKDFNATKLILLKIGNKLYREREKQTINEIKLVKAYNDSLVVELSNNAKTIKRKS